MTDLFNRDTQLQMMHDATVTWDVLVIGGGATGLGIAMDAVCRGYKTILLERFDFAKGTSGRTTKLIHGGVRYLAQGLSGWYGKQASSEDCYAATLRILCATSSSSSLFIIIPT